jgi:hypothetical protein
MASKIPFIVFASIFVGSFLYFLYINRKELTEQENNEQKTPDENEQ